VQYFDDSSSDDECSTYVVEARWDYNEEAKEFYVIPKATTTVGAGLLCLKF